MLKRRLSLITLMLLVTTACTEWDDAEFDADGIDDSFLVSGKGDIPNTIHENTPEARAILRVVNTFTRHQFTSEMGMYWKTAEEITKYRVGSDGLLRTDDDRVVFTLVELDSIPFVGETALRKLRAYVQKNDLIVYDQLIYSDSIPEEVSTSQMTLVRGEIDGNQTITLKLSGNLGDRLLLMLRKTSDAKWNPDLTIRNAHNGQDIVSTNPWGTSDARIPQMNDDLGRGWEMAENTSYEVVLHNANSVAGHFEFSLECVGGPCFAEEKIVVTMDRLTSLHEDELRQNIVALHEKSHLRISYYDARMEMFSSLDNTEGLVECVYTGTIVETTTIPSNLEMNAEHTWPQSLGALDGAAKSDLHHIFPVTSQINSIRNVHPFCEVHTVVRQVEDAKLGDDAKGKRCFEPRDWHKGQVARAMFYFAAVYQQNIADDEEAVLRKWHREYPVSVDERVRAEKIQIFQGSSQPFVKYPQLVDHISDF